MESDKIYFGKMATPPVLLLTHAAKYKHIYSQVMKSSAASGAIPVITANLQAPVDAYLHGVEAVAQAARTAGNSCPIL